MSEINNNENMENEDYIIALDENDNEIRLQMLDSFFYQGEEYAILTEVNEEADDADDVDCFIMKIIVSTDENGEEWEDFEPVEDAKLEAKLIEIATTKMNEDDDLD